MTTDQKYNMEKCIRAKEKTRSAGQDLARMLTRFNSARETLAKCEHDEMSFYQKNPDYSDRGAKEAVSTMWGVGAIMLLDVITLKPVASLFLHIFLSMSGGFLRFVLSLAMAGVVLVVELIVSYLNEKAREDALERGANPYLTPQFAGVIAIALFEPLLFIAMYSATEQNGLLRSPVGYLIGAALCLFIIAVHTSVLCSSAKISKASMMMRLRTDRKKLAKDTRSIRRTIGILKEKVHDKATKFAQEFSNLSLSCPPEHCTVVTDFSPETMLLIQKYIPGFRHTDTEFVLREERRKDRKPDDVPVQEKSGETPAAETPRLPEGDDSSGAASDDPVEETPPTPPKRGRGRPKGSRNRPKGAV